MGISSLYYTYQEVRIVDSSEWAKVGCIYNNQDVRIVDIRNVQK